MISLRWGNFTLQVADQTVDAALQALYVVAFVIFVLALVAILRCEGADIANVIKAFRHWWPWRRE